MYFERVLVLLNVQGNLYINGAQDVRMSFFNLMGILPLTK
jgi:hypothetical protein